MTTTPDEPDTTSSDPESDEHSRDPRSTSPGELDAEPLDPIDDPDEADPAPEETKPVVISPNAT